MEYLRCLDLKHVIRLTMYILGLFITAAGINIAIRSNLGETLASTFTVSIRKATKK